jgi:hypothetical protein
MDRATMTACFEEWCRRALADPGAFCPDWPEPTPEQYAASATNYMLFLAADLKRPECNCGCGACTPLCLVHRVNG